MAILAQSPRPSLSTPALAFPAALFPPGDCVVVFVFCVLRLSKFTDAPGGRRVSSSKGLVRNFPHPHFLVPFRFVDVAAFTLLRSARVCRN